MMSFQFVRKLLLSGCIVLLIAGTRVYSNQNSTGKSSGKTDTTQIKVNKPDTATLSADSTKVQKLADTSHIKTKAENSISAASSEQVSMSKDKFYKKWWFSLLIVIILSPFIYNFLKKKGAGMTTELDDYKKKEEELNAKLIEQQEVYDKREKEFSLKMQEEERLKFQAVGLSKFAELMSASKSDLKLLGQQLIYELVQYVGAHSGLIYTLNSETENDPYLEILSSYAADLQHREESIRPGEGFVGTCFKEKKTTILRDIPETYFKISSGLGNALPRYIAFVPLLQDEEVLGVIELAAFSELEDYKIEFIEKLSQSLASTITIKIATERMQLMLEKSREQSEELRAQEEELRQNLEEMHATQEDLNRQVENNKVMQKELMKEKALLDALLTYLPDYLYFKDLDSKFIHVSKSMLRIFKVRNVKQMIGKSDFDFIEKETAQKYYDEEQEIIKKRKGIVDVIKQEIFENGVEQWSSITKMPLITDDGECIGTFGITKDITEIKNLELEAQKQAEIMRQQEAEILKEKALMDALMDNIPDNIYFKDLKSRFIKNSTSLAMKFGLKEAWELEGKSDFDFFDDEHARPAYEDEQRIIKTGEAIVNLVEKEVTKDGTVTWASTTKMPLKDQNGNIIGTFGISKDITAMKDMEIETQQRNEELQSQEEELRQNLEEMQTIQEELQRNIKENERMQEELMKEKALMDALMNNVPDSIYFKDRDSKFMKNSASMAKMFNVKDVAELVGKSDFDFFDEEHARPAFEDEQKIIKTGKPIIGLVEKEVKKDGSVSWVNTTKMPLRDVKGKIIGTFGISKDITEMKNLEIEAQQRNEELLAQEEELRQNLEEMQTIQEDLQRNVQENKKMHEELMKEKALMDALMSNVPDSIYFKDRDSKFIKNSASMAKMFNVKNVGELVGKSDFDFFDDEHARPAFEDEQKIIKTGKPIVGLIEKEVKKDGSVSWVNTTKMPLRDVKGKIIGTFGISKDITEMKNLEIEAQQRNEELLAQEEELRQNLEEMQAIQEDLQRNVKENQRMHEELMKEKALMDALMNNVPDSIYFKDRDSKFIKNSASMAKMFNVKNVEELVGKSDFDFFDEEHARPAFEDEQKIIKTGKPIVGLIEKEVKKDGSVSWVNTTKMPLRDSEGKTIGTFGISKDITEMKNLEIEAQQRNEELLAQEEELRQNLEEMQTIQEDLQRNIQENKKMHEELMNEKALMDALMNNVPEAIYFKDRDSKFIKNSASMAKMFNVKNVDELVGKSDFDFFDEEHARPAFEDEQKIIKTGKPIVGLVEKEIKKDGSVSWVNTTKLPLRDAKGKIIGTFGISKDVTIQKNLELELQQRNAEEKKKINEKLMKEKALMDALMDNIPDYIYFKDRDSKFIKNSTSHAKAFGLSDTGVLIGKSDFDFFDDEHARPAFEDEQKIIKTGKPIIGLIEKEVKKDGTVSWVNTTKMPLRDTKGKIIGTFGISKDVTVQKNLELEAQKRNEDLLAKEEELRQNIEEMQTIQEDLHKRINENEKQKKQFQQHEKELQQEIDRLKKEIANLRST